MDYCDCAVHTCNDRMRGLILSIIWIMESFVIVRSKVNMLEGYGNGRNDFFVNDDFDCLCLGQMSLATSNFRAKRKNCLNTLRCIHYSLLRHSKLDEKAGLWSKKGRAKGSIPTPSRKGVST